MSVVVTASPGHYVWCSVLRTRRGRRRRIIRWMDSTLKDYGNKCADTEEVMEKKEASLRQG